MHRRIVLIAGALIVIAAGLWVSRVRGVAATPPRDAASTPAPKEQRVALHRAPDLSASSQSAVKSKSSSPESWLTVDKSKDKYALAKALLPLARAGDAKAQYLLFRVMWDCLNPDEAHQYKIYPTWEAKRDQLIQNAIPQKNIDDEEAQYQVCAGYFENDIKSFGNAWDWLQQATDSGYAPAQAATAAQRLRQDEWRVMERAGAATGELSSLPPIGGDASPRELLALAVQSDDPEVLFTIGSLQHELNPTQPLQASQLEAFAWEYAGCQRLGGCPEDYGPGTITNCPPNATNCVPVPNEFLRAVGGNWAPIQERVNQINAAIAAQQWDQLGLGS